MENPVTILSSNKHTASHSDRSARMPAFVLMATGLIAVVLLAVNLIFANQPWLKTTTSGLIIVVSAMAGATLLVLFSNKSAGNSLAANPASREHPTNPVSRETAKFASLQQKPECLVYRFSIYSIYA